MKKMIFLLLMAVALTSFALAYSPAQPPGAITLEAVMSEVSAVFVTDNSDTVLVTAMSMAIEQSSIQAVMAFINVSAIQPKNSGTISSTPMIIGQDLKVYAADCFYLRC
jgi:hydrogenase maturation factor